VSASPVHRRQHPCPTRRSSDLAQEPRAEIAAVVSALFEAMRAGDGTAAAQLFHPEARLQSVSEQNGASSLRSDAIADFIDAVGRSEEHTSELQSRENLVCRLLL